MSAHDWLGPQFDPTTADYSGTAYSFGHRDVSAADPDQEEVWNSREQTNALGQGNADVRSPGGTTVGKIMDTKPFVPNETLGQDIQNSWGFKPGLS